MGKWFAGFLILFVVMSILSGMMAGGDGYVITALDGNIDSDDTTITVDSTNGFLTTGTIVIDYEHISYSGKTSTQFTGGTRGADSTTATSHSSGKNVYSEDADLIAYAMGWDVAQTIDQWGGAASAIIPVRILTTTLPHLMLLNFQFLEGDLALLAVVFYCSLAGMMLTLAIMLIGAIRTNI